MITNKTAITIGLIFLSFLISGISAVTWAPYTIFSKSPDLPALQYLPIQASEFFPDAGTPNSTPLPTAEQLSMDFFLFDLHEMLKEVKTQEGKKLIEEAMRIRRARVTKQDTAKYEMIERLNDHKED